MLAAALLLSFTATTSARAEAPPPASEPGPITGEEATRVWQAYADRWAETRDYSARFTQKIYFTTRHQLFMHIAEAKIQVIHAR